MYQNPKYTNLDHRTVKIFAINPAHVMFWAAIVGNELVRPFRVLDGVKMTSKLYIDFLKEHLVLWHKRRVWHSEKTRFLCLIMSLLMLQG